MIHVASQALQKTDTTLVQASSVLQASIQGLQEMRRNWEEVWTEILSFCESGDISVTEQEPRQKRPAQMTATLTSALVGSTLDTSVSKSPKDRWVKHLLYPVIDTLVGSCNKRFSEEAMQIAKSVDAVLKCDADGAAGLIKQYSSTLSINADLAHAEMVMVKMSSRDVTLENVRAAVLTGFYPNFTKVLKLVIFLPVGTATCEHSFSAMRRVRNWMRTTMAQQRLSSLSLLYIESDITKRIKPEEIVDRYDTKTPWRLLLH